MNSIVTDYRKCVSIIESCKTREQLNSCDNLAENFHQKHEKKRTSLSRWRELSNLIHAKKLAS
jgi:hypothetical protein